MSQWADRVRNHAVWQHLQSLGPVIDQALGREAIDPQTIDSLERLRAVLAFSGKRLAAADPMLLPPAPLDPLSTAFQNAISEVQAFIANGSPGHITNANTHADTALGYIGQIVVPTTPEELAALKDAASSYRDSLLRSMEQARSGVESVRVESESLRARLTELGNDITAEKQRAAQLASEQQLQFSAAQENRTREFSEAQTLFTAQKDAAVRASQDMLAELKTGHSQTAEHILEQMRKHQREVEKLVGVIGNLGVTSGYLKTANAARTTMWVWQAITVLALGGLIFVAFYAFIPLVQGTFTWESFAGRIFLSLTVGVLAAYAANQADKAQATERHNRRLALELEAMGPYLAPLPQDLQDKFRLQIGELSFGREDVVFGKRGDKSPATVVDVLSRSKEFREFVEGIIRAVKPGG